MNQKVERFLNLYLPGVGFIAVTVCYVYYARIVLGQEAGFDSDEYLHAAPAMEMYHALRNREFRRFWDVIQGESFYPPMYPLLVALGYCMFPPSVASSRLPSLVLLFLSATVLASTCGRISRAIGKKELHSSLLVFLLTLFSNRILLNSSLCMIESLGIFLIALLVFVLSGEQVLSRRKAVITGLFASALSLTKYTFPALAIPGLVCSVCCDAKDWKQLWRRIRWLALCALVCIIIGGSWLCIAHTGEIRRFLFDHPARGYAIGISRWLYYPTTFDNTFLLYPVLLTPVAILALTGMSSSWSNLATRFSVLSLLFSFMILSVIAERGGRHISPVIPGVWLLTGLGWRYLHANVFTRIGTWVSPMLVGVLVCVYTWGFLIGNSWIKPAVLRIMEYRPTWHGIYVDIAKNLDSSKPIFFAGGKTLPRSNYLVLLMAIRNDMPPSAVHTLFVYPSGHEVRSLSKDVHTMSTEALREALRSLHDRYRFGTYVLLVDRKDDPRKELLRRIAQDICTQGTCVVRRKRAASYLIFHSEKLFSSGVE